MRTPVFLQHNRRLDRSFLALELERRNIDLWFDFVLIGDTVKQLFFLRLLQIHLGTRQFCHFTALDVGYFDV